MPVVVGSAGECIAMQITEAAGRDECVVLTPELSACG